MKFFLLILGLGFSVAAADPLPSWNQTAPKQAITAFVEKVTKAGSTDFVPPGERIAVFDNDGCLWSEQPMYFQAFFVFDRIKQLAPQHPEWKEKEPFASVLKGDLKSALAGGEHAVAALMAATHSGMTTDAAREWAYDRESPVGKLAKGLDEAPKRGWTVVSMKDDWKAIHPQ